MPKVIKYFIKKEIKMKIEKNSNFNYIWNVVGLILIAYSATLESTLFLIIGISFLVLLILTGNCINDFYVYVSLIPFTIYLTNVSDITQLIFIGMLGVSIFKLFFQKAKYRLNILILISAIYLMIIELFNDLIIANHIHSLSVLHFMAYFIMFILRIDLGKYNHVYSLRNLISGLIIALITISFGFNKTLDDLVYTENVFRLGEESGISRLLGGAMAVPIYSLLIISLLISYMFLNKTTIKEKLILIPCIVFPFIVGFLTVSRLYLLGLGVFTICIILSVFSKKGYKMMIFLLTGLSLLITYIYFNPIILENILMKFGQRTTNGFFNDIRMQIYISVIEYFGDNPEFLLLGKGALNYVLVGKEEGYLFSMMAHNLYLDALISWGVFGVLFLTYIITFYVKKCKSYSTNRVSILTVMPIVILTILYMTQGSFNYFDVYMYILFLILHIFYGENIFSNTNKFNKN
jgi:hypothetical protein